MGGLNRKMCEAIFEKLVGSFGEESLGTYAWLTEGVQKAFLGRKPRLWSLFSKLKNKFNFKLTLNLDLSI